MSIFKITATIVVATAVLVASPSKKDPELKSAIKTGNKSSKLLLKTLGKNMKKNMKSGGVFQALDFCSNEAYSITESVNKELPKGVTVKRISAKNRSDANKPTAKELAVLQTFENMQKQNIVLPKFLVEKVDTQTMKFYKPLVINKQVCLKCHGDITNKKLKAEITSRYPNDKATHYKMGDLRGAIVVTIKK